MAVRASGWLLLVLAVAAVVQNGLAWWAGGTFHVLALSGMWSHFDYGSFEGVKNFISDLISPRAWSLVMLVLRLPAAAVFVFVGLGLLWIGQPGSRASSGVGDAASGDVRRRRRRGRGELS